ncbi:uncharacterized protein METZ01_LOCUS89280 [marine metagenome]|uniref:Uncharacterized protein n=1 Tax=marine metagenome TaxID=408172 RepID=A0A381V7R6_9ZZZZ
MAQAGFISGGTPRGQAVHPEAWEPVSGSLWGTIGGYQFDAASCQPAKQRITPLGSSNRDGSRPATSVSGALS